MYGYITGENISARPFGAIMPARELRNRERNGREIPISPHCILTALNALIWHEKHFLENHTNRHEKAVTMEIKALKIYRYTIAGNTAANIYNEKTVQRGADEGGAPPRNRPAASVRSCALPMAPRLAQLRPGTAAAACTDCIRAHAYIY